MAKGCFKIISKMFLLSLYKGHFFALNSQIQETAVISLQTLCKRKARPEVHEFSSRSLPHEDINNYLKSLLGDAVLRDCTTLGSFSF